MTKLMLGNNLETLKQLPDNSVDSIVTDPPYGLSFMGKKWDYDVPTTELWQECFRVLKHGGHLLAFFGTRTYHRGVVRIEDAGFEIRDQIQWIYGSGFPKSHNIGKAIDKAAGVEREVIGKIKTHDIRKNALMDKKGTAEFDLTTPKTESAKQWDGWGTALKPANEPIVVARKPLEKGLTVAENVLKYGTGAINVDECRIEGAFESGWSKSGSKESENTSMSGKNYARDPKPDNPQGRWPANVILDETAAEMLDEQSGPCKTGALTGQPRVENKIYGSAANTLGKPRFYEPDAATGASRFFYVAKASKSERNKGLEGMPKKPQGAYGEFAGDGRGRQTEHQPTANFHPTVKPIKLMQYLIKLVTPPNGTVLDPFMGSGSTGVAAKELGFNFVGCELSPEYFEIAEKRIEALND